MRWHKSQVYLYFVHELHTELLHLLHFLQGLAETIPHLNQLFGFAPLTVSKFVFVACWAGTLFPVNVGRSQDLKCYASCCWIWSSVSLHRHLVHAVLLIGMAHTHLHTPPEAFTPHPQGQASEPMCVSCRCAITLNLASLSLSAFVFLCMVGHQVHWVTYMRLSLSPGIIWVNDIIHIFVLFINLFKNTRISFQGGIGDFRVISVYHNEEKNPNWINELLERKP